MSEAAFGEVTAAGRFGGLVVKVRGDMANVYRVR